MLPRFRRSRGRSLALAWVLLAGVATAGSALAQRSTGTIVGLLPESKPQLEHGIEALLVEAASGSVVQTVRVGENGRFQFDEVPIGAYYVMLQLDKVLLNTRPVTVNSPVPVVLNYESMTRYQTREVQVTAPRVPLVDLAPRGTGRSFSAEAIGRMPAPTADKRIESLLLSTPGVVPDEDGRLHVRGEDAQIQYVIDGIPVTGNMTRVYSSLFDAGRIKAVDVLTGGLDAEYGVASAGIVALTTKSGYDRPRFANASIGTGTFQARDVSVDVGGNASGRSAFYLSAGHSGSNRYLDPITGGAPNHDDGSSTRFFGKLSRRVRDDLKLDLIGAADGTDFQVPNGLARRPAQDQRQRMRDYMLGGRGEYILGDHSVLGFLAYHRRTGVTTTSEGLTRLGTADEIAEAVARNEKLFVGGDRVERTTGAQIDLSLQRKSGDATHSIKGGLSGEIYPLSEFFTFAVTNPDLADSTKPDGDSRFLPYDVTRGGAPFLVDTRRTGRSASAFLQDRVEWRRWVVRTGMRFDTFHLFTTESSLSPRLSVAWSAGENLVLRAGYERQVMRAPLENILVSSSDQARQWAGLAQGSTPTQVRSERAHVGELGLTRRWSRHFDTDLSIYGKRIKDFIVKTELQNSGVIFPVNLRDGLVAGGDLSLRMRETGGFSGQVSLSVCQSVGQTPRDGSSPVTGGLLIGEEGRNYSHPWSGEDTFKTEHNQLLTAVLNLAYHDPSGAFANLDARYDSGLPFDLTGPDGQGLNEEESRQELLRRGYTNDVIDLLNLKPEKPGSPDKSVAPHQVIDVGAGLDFAKRLRWPVTASVSVMNLFDARYLYKFESAFGATHFGRPRSFTVRLDYRY